MRHHTALLTTALLLLSAVHCQRPKTLLNTQGSIPLLIHADLPPMLIAPNRPYRLLVEEAGNQEPWQLLLDDGQKRIVLRESHIFPSPETPLVLDPGAIDLDPAVSWRLTARRGKEVRQSPPLQLTPPLKLNPRLQVPLQTIPIGKTIPLVWEETAPDGNFSLWLFQNGTALQRLASKVSTNQPYFAWEAGVMGDGTGITGTGFRIRLIPESDPYAWEETAPFSLERRPFLQITQPLGGDIPLNRTLAITWDAPEASGTLDVVLRNGQGKELVVARGVPVGQRSLNWHPDKSGADQEVQPQERYRLILRGTAPMQDQSPQTLRFIPPPALLDIRRLPKDPAPGSRLTLLWESPYLSDPIRLDLFSGNRWIGTITDSAPAEAGLFYWWLPGELNHIPLQEKTALRIRLSSQNGKLSAFSPTFTISSPPWASLNPLPQLDLLPGMTLRITWKSQGIREPLVLSLNAGDRGTRTISPPLPPDTSAFEWTIPPDLPFQGDVFLQLNDSHGRRLDRLDPPLRFLPTVPHPLSIPGSSDNSLLRRLRSVKKQELGTLSGGLRTFSLPGHPVCPWGIYQVDSSWDPLIHPLEDAPSWLQESLPNPAQWRHGVRLPRTSFQGIRWVSLPGPRIPLLLPLPGEQPLLLVAIDAINAYSEQVLSPIGRQILPQTQQTFISPGALLRLLILRRQADPTGPLPRFSPHKDETTPASTEKPDEKVAQGKARDVLKSWLVPMLALNTAHSRHILQETDVRAMEITFVCDMLNRCRWSSLPEEQRCASWLLGVWLRDGGLRWEPTEHRLHPDTILLQKIWVQQTTAVLSDTFTLPAILPSQEMLRRILGQLSGQATSLRTVL